MQIKEKPILFNGRMVKATLLGLKTMTRRVINLSEPWTHDKIDSWRLNDNGLWNAYNYSVSRSDTPVLANVPCPYGKPGDRLWGRETWAPEGDAGACWMKAGIPDYFAGKLRGWLDYPYKLDRVIDPPTKMIWRPSIFMPRWASRISLEVTEVRIERLQDISEADAIAEGVEKNWIGPDPCPPEYADEWMNYGSGEDDFPCFSAVDSFKSLWDSINGKRGHAWESNPWLWVVEFKVIDA